uniref:Uncharacterized protein n=1 Tax=Knipowitschia caucasica TaxID=637954 RepID=A0AAV2MI44_KNICA
MHHVPEVQQKHLEYLQDPPGLQLYTKVGTQHKGGKELDILRCGRGSSFLESFHRHQCAFIPDERTAVEYLLGQTNRGDLLAPAPAPENPSQVLEEEEAYASTHMPELLAGDARDQLLEGDTEPIEPVTPETSQCDSRGVVGGESVDALAAYLAGLNRTTTALSAKEEAEIVCLYTALMDKAPSRYSQKGR